jgi:miniconductance mechanosensitive channel
VIETLLELHPAVPTTLALVALIAGALIADQVIKRVLLRFVGKLIHQTALGWDDILVQHNVLGLLAQAVPGVIVGIGIRFVPGLSESVAQLIGNVATAFVVMMLTMALAAALGVAVRIYETQPIARDRPLRGFVQVLQILIYVLGLVIAIATVLDRSPLLLLSGLGAMTAVLLLVFKDTILGLVASVQLAANNMVRIGDWIEMPQLGADGDVIEVSLHTVKVQNWDKTITTIPTYKLIDGSFKNWRGMAEAGGRRIKRSIYIDQTSIRFVTDDEIEELREFSLLRPYIDAKVEGLATYHATLGADAAAEVNRRRLTNVGTFRAYVRQYLKGHPAVSQDMTLLVRQLEPGPDGLPIELYCFTRTTEWAQYEGVQSDIFDHVIAILPRFHLRLYQRPSGADIANLLDRD